MNRSRRRWLWLALSLIALALVVLFLSHSSQWKNFQWSIVWTSLTHARLAYVILAIAATYATAVARAYRWQFFLEPVKRASAWNLFVAQILGFSAIYLIGRAGEVVRPAYIARAERVTFTSQLAIWLLERVYDGIAVVLLLALALGFQPLHLASAHATRSLHRMHEGAVVILVLCGALVVGLVLFRLYSEAALQRLPALLSWAPRRFREPLRRLVHSFSTGLEVIQNLRDFLASAAWTVVLWFLNASIFFLVIRSVGGALAHLSWAAAAICLFFAAIGLAVQVPGVGGGYQAAIILALQELFTAPPSQATAAGLLIGAVVMLPYMALGAVLLVYEGLTLGKLKSIAEEGKGVLA